MYKNNVITIFVKTVAAQTVFIDFIIYIYTYIHKQGTQKYKKEGMKLAARAMLRTLEDNVKKSPIIVG